MDHLTGEKWIGSRYLKYTYHITFDFDNSSLDEIDLVRLMLDATPLSAMLCTSISEGHYHLHKLLPLDCPPVSIDRIQRAYKPFTDRRLFEVFPQRNQGCRLPFGKFQQPIDKGCRNLVTWEDQLDYLCNLQITPLIVPRYYQQKLDFGPDKSGISHRRHVTPAVCDPLPLVKSRPYKHDHSASEAIELMELGLPGPGTRNMATFDLFLDQRKQGASLNDAIKLVKEFIRHKHNNFSKEYPRHPLTVFNHITDQGKRAYDRFDKRGILPTDKDCTNRQYITTADIPKILRECNANLPIAKFIAFLVMYFSTRYPRELVRISSKNFKKWGSKNFYKQMLDELESRGLIHRGADYRNFDYSKYIMLNWEFVSPSHAVYFNGRLARTLEEAIVASYTQAEARLLFIDSGFPRENAKKIVNRIYSHLGDKKGHII